MRTIRSNTREVHEPHARDPVVVIGLDAVEAGLLEEWVARGELPFLAGLMRRGSYTRLRSPLFPDSPWATLHTGVSPGTHAFFALFALSRGTTRMERVSSRACRRLPFWQYLRGTGLRVVALDVPKAVPVPGVDGVQVCGWAEHYPQLRPAECSPPHMIAELEQRFGRFSHPDELVHPPSREWERATLVGLLDDVERMRGVTEYLLERERFDLFLAVFAEAHNAAHQFYHYLEERHWAHEEDAPAELRRGLLDVVQRMDQALARLSERLPERCTLMVVSVHGIAPNYSANPMLAEVLTRLGYQVPAAAAPRAAGVGRVLELTSAVRALIPRRVRDFINRHVVPDSIHDRMDANAFAGTIDWGRSRAFMLPSDHFQGFISLNLRGREPEGIVSPGAEADALCEDIRRELLRLVNADTGRAAVSDVLRVADVHPGPNVHLLPDLVVRWAADSPLHRVEHPDIGVVEAPACYPLRKTQHTEHGFLLAAGPAIQPGSVAAGADVRDIAPTALHLLGVDVPEELEGRVLHELLAAARPGAAGGQRAAAVPTGPAPA